MQLSNLERAKTADQVFLQIEKSMVPGPKK
jgi:hypothetical protein